MAVVIRPPGGTVTVRSGYFTVEARTPKNVISASGGVIRVGGDPYMYDYEVVPDTSEHDLPTRGKTLREDIVVHPIPYHTTTNEAGGYTVSIAS